MTVNNSLAKKKFWAKFTKSERKKMMSSRAKNFWKTRTIEQRQAHSQKMLEARSKKNEMQIL